VNLHLPISLPVLPWTLAIIMGDPVSNLAAKEAVTLGASLVTESYKFGKLIRQASKKAKSFESTIAAADGLLRAAASQIPEVPAIEPQVDGLRRALVSAQCKQEYELKKPRDGALTGLLWPLRT